LGKEFSEYSYIKKLPENADFIKVQISGSIDYDEE